MGSGKVLGVKIHHWAYLATFILFLREFFDVILGFTWNILLLVGAFVTAMILLIALAALSNHGIGVYRAFFVFYFLLLGATFLSLLIGLIVLRTGRAAADFGYERGFLNTAVGSFIETEHQFWRFYIYFSFVFFVFELLYVWIMFKAYYQDKASNEEKRQSRRQQASGQLPAHFSFSMSGQPHNNPYINAQAPPQYSERKEYCAPSILPNGGAYTPLKTITDV